MLAVTRSFEWADRCFGLARKSTAGIELSEQFIVLIVHCPTRNAYHERSLHVNGLGFEPAKATCFGSKPAYARDGCCPEREYDASQSDCTQCSYLRFSTPVFRLLTRISEPFLLRSIHQDVTSFVVYCRAMPALVKFPQKTIRSPNIFICLLLLVTSCYGPFGL